MFATSGSLLCRVAGHARIGRLAVTEQPISQHAVSVTVRSFSRNSTQPRPLLPSSLSRFSTRNAPLHRLHTRASSHGSRSRSGPFFTGSIAVAGTGLAIYAVTFHRQALAAEPEAKGEQDDDDHKFAPSVEEHEDEEEELRNPVVRAIHRFGRVVHRFIIEPLGTAKRFIVLVCLFLPVMITAPMLLVGSRGNSSRRRGRRTSNADPGERWGALWWYGFLVKQMERAGPTFIKLAQWAGSRQDLFPDELCKRLGRLHSNGKPHSFRYTKKVIERVFGRKFDEIFEEFQHEPMGIGAVAQVYKAKLRPDLLPPAYLQAKNAKAADASTIRRSTKKLSQTLALTYDEDTAPPKIPTAAVAIKILHPAVEKTITRDIRIMKFFASMINLIPGAEWLSFPEEVDVFAGMMFDQLDLRNEAKNLERFENNFSSRRAAISFPRPLIEFSTKQMLIEEFEEAVPLKHFLNMGGAGFDHRIANLGLDAFLNMLLIDNFTHADLHPGNIMIKFYRPTTKSLLEDVLARILSKFDSDYAPGHSKAPVSANERAEESVVQQLLPLHKDHDAWLDALDALDAEGYQPELVFLDAGLTVDLTEQNRRNFIDLFSAVAQFDGALAGHLMVERCRSPEMVIDEDVFAMKMQDLILSVKSKTFSLAKIKISDILNEVLLAVRTHHVKMEPDFVNTVISILLLEGIGRQLDPNMDLFKSALPILRSLGKQISKQDGAAMVHDKGGMKQAMPMIKLWLYMEARSLLSGFVEASPATVDAFARYGWFSD